MYMYIHFNNYNFFIGTNLYHQVNQHYEGGFPSSICVLNVQSVCYHSDISNRLIVVELQNYPKFHVAL